MKLSINTFVGLAVLVATTLTAGCETSSSLPACTTGWLSETGHRGEQFSSAPKMVIDKSCHYSAQIVTTKGIINVGLNPKAAPIAVNNLVYLATHKFYTNIIFHRVIKGFMIQTGDPTGTGSGGPGYSYKIENSGSSYPPGTVALAHSSLPNSNGSQFFICEGATCAASLDSSWSNGGTGYTILGAVTSGLSVVRAIAAVPVKANAQGEVSAPINPPVMTSVRIHESP